MIPCTLQPGHYAYVHNINTIYVPVGRLVNPGFHYPHVPESGLFDRLEQLNDRISLYNPDTGNTAKFELFIKHQTDNIISYRSVELFPYTKADGTIEQKAVWLSVIRDSHMFRTALEHFKMLQQPQYAHYVDYERYSMI